MPGPIHSPYATQASLEFAQSPHHFADAGHCAAQCLMLLLSGQLVRRDVKELLATQQLSMVSLVASDVNEALALRLKLLSDLATKIGAAPLMDANAAQAMLEQHPVLQNLFNDGVFVVDASGRINANLPLKATRLGQVVNDLEYFNTVKATGQPVICSFTRSWFFCENKIFKFTWRTGDNNIRSFSIFLTGFSGRAGSS